MNRDKQIEEIARVLDECCNEYDERGNQIRNKCASCEYWSDTNHICVSYNIKESEALYNAGYRKASEVAREIFEEIEEVIAQSNVISDIRMRELAPHTHQVMREAGKLYYTAIIRAIDELKKKYTEEKKDV